MADVLEMARAIATDGPWTREAVEIRAAHIIGAALAQERERCAKIADVAAEQWRTSERSAKAKGADYTASFIGGSALAASNIARSIRAHPMTDTERAGK